MRTNTLLVAALLWVVTACSGHDVVGPDTVPSPPESVSVRLISPTTDTTVTVASLAAQASVVANVSVTVSWTVNGTAVGHGTSMSLQLVAGQNNVCVTAKGTTKSSQVCVVITYTPPVPHITCLVVAAHETAEALQVPLRVRFTSGADTVYKAVGLDGNCSVDSDLGKQDSVRAVLTDSTGTYAPMIVASAPTAGMVLITIPRRFDGQDVDLTKAYVPSSDSLSFYARHVVPNTGGKYWYMVESFLASDLPKPAVFDTTSGQAISKTGVDTAWAGTHQLESRLTWQFSRPLNQGEKVSNVDYTLQFRNDSTIPKDELANARVVWDGAKYIGGTVTFAFDSLITSTTVMHELIHVLGFGHGCGWHGIMNGYCNTTWYKHDPVPSALDIAYINLMYRTRALERKYSTKFSIPESEIAEEVFVLGLPEKQLYKAHP